MTKDNDCLSENLKQSFDESVEKLPAETLSKINVIRNKSLDKNNRQKSQWLPLIVSSSFVAVCLVSILYFNYQAPLSDLDFSTDDLELLSSSENLELLEDLDFYLWLEENELST